MKFRELSILSKNCHQDLAKVVVGLLFLFGSLIHSPWFQPLQYDSEIYNYIGMLISEGGIPYIDVFDHKPPFIYFVSYLGFQVTPNSTWGIFFLTFGLGLWSVMLLFERLREMLGSTIKSLFISTIYVGLISYPYILQEPFLTRQLAAYMIVIFWAIGTSKLGAKIKFLMLGALMSIVFLTQQNEFVAMLIWFFYFIFSDTNSVLNQKLKVKFIYTGIGVALPLIITTGILLLWQNIEQFWNDAFIFNYKYVSTNSLYERLINTLAYRKSLVLIKLLFPILLVINIFRHGKKFKIHTVCLATCIVQFLSIALSGRAFSHYFLTLIPYLVIWMVYTFVDIKVNSKLRKFVLAATAIIIGIFTLKHLSYLQDKKPYDVNNPVAIEVGKVKGEIGQFYSFDPSYLRINHNLRIVAPSKWVYSHFAFTSLDPNGRIISEIISDLDKWNTKYVLNNPQSTPEGLSQYLNEKYVKIMQYHNRVLLERK